MAVIVGLALLFLGNSARAQLVAEQVTAGNVASTLFGGTDADGGIDDWYLSNGVVAAIIDDVGPQADLVPLLGAAAPPKVSEFAFTGGSLLDLGLVGQNNDQLTQIFTVGGLSTSNFILYSSIGASVSGSEAKITVTGNLLGFDTGATPVPSSDLDVVTEFIAAGSDPFLTMVTTVTNNHGSNAAAGLGGFLDAAIWTLRAVVPFSPLANRGFTHPIIDFSNPAAALEFPTYSAGPANVSPADGVIDPTNATTCGEVSYGLLGVEVSVDQDGPGGNAPVVTPTNTLFGISSNLVTAFGSFPAAPSLDPGGILRYTRRLYVGNRNDVASAANPMITELASRQAFATGTISGNVDAADAADVAASIIATKTGGAATPGFAANAPASQFRTDATGAFSGIVLPVGTYDLEVRSAERDTVTVSGVVVNASADTAVTIPALSAQGTVNVSVVENVAGPDPQIPAKFVFKGYKGTADPRFKKDFEALALPIVGDPIDLAPETFGGGNAQRNVAYLGTGTGTLKLSPGKYQVYVSRGPEYTIKRKNVNVKAGKTKTLKFKIRRAVDTAGFISADFHVHSGRSLDSSAPLRDRVVSFAGEGVEVLVSTEHDYNIDYSSTIADLGLGSRMTSMVGNEVTGSVPNEPAFPDSVGHINAWPLSVLPDARRDGSIEDEFVAPNFLFKRLRDQGAQVIQYNHPRAGVSGLTAIGIFNNFGYDPDLPVTSPPNDLLLDQDVLGPGISGVTNPDGIRNIDFDVMEILNGTSISQYVAVRRDWLSLLNQTDGTTVPFIPGTAVSDSHKMVLEDAGYARAYVGGVGDNPSGLDVTAFNSNVNAGNMSGTTGPFITVSAASGSNTAGLGQTLVAPGGNVTLTIKVQAANWIPVEEVRIIANGFVTQTFDATTSPAVKPAPGNPLSQGTGAVTRFAAEVPLTASVDTYFIVEAGAKLSPLPTASGIVDTIVPGMVPLGFTNPIFVDLAGDGFDPPGLPVMASATGAGEALPAFARVERRDESWWARVRGWWQGLLASGRSRGTAVAGHDIPPLTGRELKAVIDQQKKTPTPDYFPLYHFRLPDSVVEPALERLPEPERTRIRENRRRANPRSVM
jgi:hypothetical protein